MDEKEYVDVHIFDLKFLLDKASLYIRNLKNEEYSHREKRVKSIMIEINRELYMDETTGEKNNSFVEIKSDIFTLISQIIAKFSSNFDKNL